MVRGNFRVDDNALREMIRRYDQVEGEFDGVQDSVPDAVDAGDLGDTTNIIESLLGTMVAGGTMLIEVSNWASDVIGDFMNSVDGNDFDSASRFRKMKQEMSDECNG